MLKACRTKQISTEAEISQRPPPCGNCRGFAYRTEFLADFLMTKA